MDKSKDQQNDQKAVEQSAPPRLRRYGRRMGDQQEENTVWLISFTDVMALMLTFFVLLFAMSHPKEEEWDNFAENVKENFSRFQSQPLNRGFQDAINIEKINFSKALDINYLNAILEDLIAKESALKVVKLIVQDNGLIVSLPQDMLFEVGRAQVKDDASRALFTLAGTLSRIKNRIEVVGHTDPRPVTSGRYQSNWALSLARAANVAAVLENVGYSEPVIVRGQAAGRYSDLPNSIGEIERLDLSRRVDIIIKKDSGQRLQLFSIDG
ncbi:MAG: flagellar motor protein MotB [Pseudomonadota bacterium]